MRCLITGGAGFIGSHLAQALLESGHRVDILDDLSTGSLSNLEALQGRERLTTTVQSVLSRPAVEELVQGADMVYHLAAAVGVFLIVQRPVRTIETNVQGTEIVLGCAARWKRPVLVASSSEVYGKSERIPFAEEDDVVLGPTTQPRWSYAASKMIDEYLALAYWKEFGLPTVVGRFFNTVGPRQTGRYGMVIPRLVEQALRGGPLTVFGDGMQSRCFCHVADVVSALPRLLSEPRAFGRIFNIGSEEEITILALAEKIRALIDPGLEIRRIPYDEAYERGFSDMRRRVPDLSRIKSLIGYSPRRNIDDILADVISEQRAARPPRTKDA